MRGRPARAVSTAIAALDDAVYSAPTVDGQPRPPSVAVLVEADRVVEPHADAEGTKILRLAPGMRALLGAADLTIHIEPDASRAWETSANLYSQAMAEASGDAAISVRRMLLVIARLKDLHPSIDYGAVTDLMRSVHVELTEQHAAAFDGRPEAADVPRHIAVSMRRLVAASTRASRGGASHFTAHFSTNLVRSLGVDS